MRSSRLEAFIAEKRKESLLGFASLHLERVRDDTFIDGVLNISERQGNGEDFLILSCLLDVENNGQKEMVRNALKRMDFGRRPPPNLQTLLRSAISLDRAEHMMMEELTFSFTKLKGMHEELLKKHILPELKRCGFTVGNVQWFEKPRSRNDSILKKVSDLKIMKLFG